MSGRSEPAAVLGDGSVAGRGGTVTSLQDHVVGVFSARDLELGQRPFLLETMKLRCCMGFGCLLGTWLTSPMGWTSHSPPAEKGLGLTIKSEDPHLSRTRSRLFTANPATKDQQHERRRRSARNIKVLVCFGRRGYGFGD